MVVNILILQIENLCRHSYYMVEYGFPCRSICNTHMHTHAHIHVRISFFSSYPQTLPNPKNLPFNPRCRTTITLLQLAKLEILNKDFKSTVIIKAGIKKCLN